MDEFQNVFDAMSARWKKLIDEGRCPFCAAKNSETEARCKAGDHCWDIGALGPDVASFSCNHCDGESHGSTEPLKQLGFVEVKP